MQRRWAWACCSAGSTRSRPRATCSLRGSRPTWLSRETATLCWATARSAITTAAARVDTSGAPTSLTVPIGQGVIGQVSATTVMGGNLDRDATAAVSTTIATYDATGGQHKVALDFTKTAGNTWEWTAGTADTDGTVVSYNADTDTTAERTVTFDGTTGKVTSPTAGLTINIAPPAPR